jgi:dGTPase
MKYPKKSLPKKPTKDIADKNMVSFKQKTFSRCSFDMGLIPNKSEVDISKDILALFKRQMIFVTPLLI